jgi:hypothetical protein
VACAKRAVWVTDAKANVGIPHIAEHCFLGFDVDRDVKLLRRLADGVEVDANSFVITRLFSSLVVSLMIHTRTLCFCIADNKVYYFIFV